MEALFRWSKVYCIAHEQSSYLLLTVEYGAGNHAGVMLPADTDDVWNVAASRLTSLIGGTQRPATTHEQVVAQFSEWTAKNLRGRFAIAELPAMVPPLHFWSEDQPA